jgi:hypothetical protein
VKATVWAETGAASAAKPKTKAKKSPFIKFLPDIGAAVVLRDATHERLKEE